MAQTVLTRIRSVVKVSWYSPFRRQIDSTRSKDEQQRSRSILTRGARLRKTTCNLSKKLDSGGGSTSSVDNSVHKSFTKADCPYTDACTNLIAYFLGIARARHSTPISCGGLPLPTSNPQLVMMMRNTGDRQYYPWGNIRSSRFSRIPEKNYPQPFQKTVEVRRRKIAAWKPG